LFRHAGAVSVGSGTRREGNVRAGIEVGVPEASYTPSGNFLEGNRVTHNGGDGLFIGPGSQPDSSATIVARNVTSWNQDDGIDVESANSVVSGNRARMNGDLGIEAVPGVADGGGNRAFGNGNPLQCVNIFCR
jgi:Right handed beta helix region